jgi:hypothetical protein
MRKPDGTGSFWGEPHRSQKRAELTRACQRSMREQGSARTRIAGTYDESCTRTAFEANVSPATHRTGIVEACLIVLWT